MSWGWEGAVIVYDQFMSLRRIVLFTFFSSWFIYLRTFASRWIGSANSFSSVFEALRSHSTWAPSSFIHPVNGGWHKGHWVFLDASSKAGSVFTGWERAGLRDLEPGLFYNAVLSVTWQVTAVKLSPQLSKQPCYIFHPPGSQRVGRLRWNQMGVFL